MFWNKETIKFEEKPYNIKLFLKNRPIISYYGHLNRKSNDNVFLYIQDVEREILFMERIDEIIKIELSYPKGKD